jgi:hypothetical protein
MTPPSLPLFTGAVNLKEFHLRSAELPFLDRFIFPNLTTLELSAMPEEEFPGTQLLDFLEASPKLRTVNIKIRADVLLRNVPLGRAVTLPNVETFYLSMGKEGPGCNIAAHILCPSARLTTLLYEQDIGDPMPAEIFPTSVAWNVIALQYTANPVEEVVFEITTAQDPIIMCSLTFLSPGPAILVLVYKITASYEVSTPLGRRRAKIFSQASITIRTHPLLANVKRLSIQDKYNTRNYDQLTQITSEVRQLLTSAGPLDALTLGVSDLRPYLAPFLDPPGFHQLDGFPPDQEAHNHAAIRQAWTHDRCRRTRKVATRAGCAL